MVDISTGKDSTYPFVPETAHRSVALPIFRAGAATKSGASFLIRSSPLGRFDADYVAAEGQDTERSGFEVRPFVLRRISRGHEDPADRTINPAVAVQVLSENSHVAPSSFY
jgi:hypothetical protein